MDQTTPRNDVARACETWLDEHGDALFRFAMMRVRNRATAEDLVQETLLAALQAYTRFAGQSSVRTWLIGILKNKIIDHLRRQGRESVAADAPNDDAISAMFDDDPGEHWRVRPSVWEDPNGALQQQQFWAAFVACLDALPPRQAEVFSLCEIDGMSGAEACKALDLTPTNLWVLMHRARLRLRQCLESSWFKPESR